MKIYNILRITIVAFLLTSSYSCSKDWLDLEPSDGLLKQDAIGDYDGAFVALNGVYDAIQGNNNNTRYYGARMIYFGDVRGTDMQANDVGSGRVLSSYQMNYTINNAPEIWDSPYRVINRANNLISSIDAGNLNDNTDKVLVDDLKGQALMARALAHFDLVRVYSQPYFVTGGTGLGVPIVTSPQAFNYTPARNTIEEVYTQVIADLTAAASLMTNDRFAAPFKSSYGGNLGFFTSVSAKALLARVYLYKGDNQNAYNTAVDVINNGGYKLWTTEEYPTVWSKSGTSEVFFEIVNASTSDWTDRESIGYLYSEDGYNDAIMTKEFVDLMTSQYANDIRQQVMLPSKKITESTPWGDSKVYINKYPGREGIGDIRVNNLSILRLSETYLIAAEAAAKLSDKANAAKYLNAIVLRGNPNATPVAEADATLDRILQEKQVEFVGEGHRFFDMMRNNKTITRYVSDDERGWQLPLIQASRSFDVDYFRVILPIPQSEVMANPNIQQNPGY